MVGIPIVCFVAERHESGHNSTAMDSGGRGRQDLVPCAAFTVAVEQGPVCVPALCCGAELVSAFRSLLIGCGPLAEVVGGVGVMCRLIASRLSVLFMGVTFQPGLTRGKWLVSASRCWVCWPEPLAQVLRRTFDLARSAEGPRRTRRAGFAGTCREGSPVGVRTRRRHRGASGRAPGWPGGTRRRESGGGGSTAGHRGWPDGSRPAAGRAPRRCAPGRGGRVDRAALRRCPPR